MRLVDSDITKLAVVVGGVVDINAPTVAELNAAKPITCAVAYGYSLGMNPSNTVTGKLGLCDQAAATRRGDAQYAADLTILRDDGQAGNDNAYANAAEVFAEPDVVIDIVRRGGIARHPEDALPDSAAFAAGQHVEIYRFSTDYPQYRTGVAKGEDADFQVVPLPTGVFNHDVEVVAGS